MRTIKCHEPLDACLPRHTGRLQALDAKAQKGKFIDFVSFFEPQKRTKHTKEKTFLQ